MNFGNGAEWKGRKAIFARKILAVVLLTGAGSFLVWVIFELGVRLVDALRDGTADDINKLLLALAGVFGAPFLVWRTRIADQQRHISQEELYTSLLTKAVEQLGATREETKTREAPDGEGTKTESFTETVPNTEVRLGAIYALEKLARDYLPLHWQIMEILCAYVRKNAGPPKPRTDELLAIWEKDDEERSDEENSALEKHQAALKPFIDVQAALTVIGRRSEQQRKFEARRAGAKDAVQDRLDLSDCHLAGVNLAHLHFQGAAFSGSCLEGALLSKAHLDGARLDWAHLESAQLSRAHLEGSRLDWAHLEGSLLSKAHLEGADLGWAHLENADFSDAHLEGAWLSWACLQGATLKGAYLEGASLYVSDVEGAIDITQEQIDSAHGDGKTLLSQGLVRPARWTEETAEDGGAPAEERS